MFQTQSHELARAKHAEQQRKRTGYRRAARLIQLEVRRQRQHR